MPLSRGSDFFYFILITPVRNRRLKQKVPRQTRAFEVPLCNHHNSFLILIRSLSYYWFNQQMELLSHSSSSVDETTFVLLLWFNRWWVFSWYLPSFYYSATRACHVGRFITFRSRSLSVPNYERRVSVSFNTSSSGLQVNTPIHYYLKWIGGCDYITAKKDSDCSYNCLCSYSYVSTHFQTWLLLYWYWLYSFS